MAYQIGSVPFEAVVSASFKTGLLGGTIIAAFVAVEWLAFDDFSMLGPVIFTFLVGLFWGGLVTALFLVFFGLPLALYGQKLGTSKIGFAFALMSAVLVSLVLATIIGIGVIPFVLIFAIPAGFFFRSEILLHRRIEE